MEKEMTLAKSIELVKGIYENIKDKDYIYNPVAYALHTVWKMADASSKKEGEVFIPSTVIEVTQCKDCRHFAHWTLDNVDYCDKLKVKCGKYDYCSFADVIKHKKML